VGNVQASRGEAGSVSPVLRCTQALGETDLPPDPSGLPLDPLENRPGFRAMTGTAPCLRRLPPGRGTGDSKRRRHHHQGSGSAAASSRACSAVIQTRPDKPGCSRRAGCRRHRGACRIRSRRVHARRRSRGGSSTSASKAGSARLPTREARSAASSPRNVRCLLGRRPCSTAAAWAAPFPTAPRG